MISMPIPEIKIVKNAVPSIYLDTNILIELSRYEKGCCTNEHINNIGALYNILQMLMRENRILCVLGNQLEEMGTTRMRENARNFLFRFTNMELKSPFQIKNMQLKIGYQNFVKKTPSITFEATKIIEKPVRLSNSSIEVHAVPMFSVEKIEEFKQNKKILAKKLNDAKNNNQVAKNYDSQLEMELKADFQVFLHHLEHYNDSPNSVINMLDALGAVYHRVGLDLANAFQGDIIKAVNSHNHFLLSSYHHKLPYIWVCSVLFAHVMQRQNKIFQSDNLDITWASAYLPFVDYAVTDTAFCNLLNESGLVDLYGAKVYCFKSLNNLLELLEKL